MTDAKSYPDMAGLADRIENHVRYLAHVNMNLSLGSWCSISNDLLAAATALRATGGVAQEAPTPAEWAAKEHDEWASNCRYIAQKTREEWTGPDYSSEDNKANHAEAREYDRKAAYHEQSARHFREMGLAVSSTDPRCTCAAIVNPNIPHARSCPLSSPED